MTRIISLINQKGGVGKTTTTAHIGYALATFHGARVLLLDYDAQSNLSMLFGIESSPAIAEALKTGELAVHEVRPNLWLLPSTTEFVQLEQWLYQNPFALRDALRGLREQFDYILIDCPPSTNIVPETALLASSDVCIITNGEPYSLQGFATIMQFVTRIQERQTELSISGIILTRYDKRKAMCREVEVVLRERYPDVYFNAPIREIQAVVDALASGMTVFEYKRTSLAVSDFRKITELFHERFSLIPA